MNQITIKSPAKVNLYLEVKDLREDGYHNIETIFQKINLCDEITLSEISSGIRLVCNNRDVPTDHNNLAYRAVVLLKGMVRRLPGLEIRIKKKIPVAGGLGGGSSNAASVLLGVKSLCQINVSQDKLMELGKKLGADVPFFISGFNTALGTGRGDEIVPLVNNLKLWLVLVNPGVKISTKDIYGSLSLKIGLTKDKRDVKILSRALQAGDLNIACKALYNRLEDVVTKRYDMVSQVKDRLNNFGARGVLMSGSGPTVYGITATREEAMRLRNKITSEGWGVFIARNFSCAERSGHDGDN